jgi:hypothetical protein
LKSNVRFGRRNWRDFRQRRGIGKERLKVKGCAAHSFSISFCFSFWNFKNEKQNEKQNENEWAEQRALWEAKLEGFQAEARYWERKVEG